MGVEQNQINYLHKTIHLVPQIRIFSSAAFLNQFYGLLGTYRFQLLMLFYIPKKITNMQFIPSKKQLKLSCFQCQCFNVSKNTVEMFPFQATLSKKKKKNSKIAPNAPKKKI